MREWRTKKIAVFWKRKQLSKKTGIELNIEISKGAKAVLSVIMTALLSVVVWIHMDHIMNGVDFFIETHWNWLFCIRTIFIKYC